MMAGKGCADNTLLTDPLMAIQRSPVEDKYFRGGISVRSDGKWKRGGVRIFYRKKND